MSGKKLLLLGVLGFCAYSLQKQSPPVPPNASRADSAATVHAGLGARFQYGLGLLGCKVVGGSVNDMVTSTERELKDLSKHIKATRGPDGARAKEYAQRVVQMDSTARVDLQYGRPVKAVRGAMQAKSLVNSVRVQLNRS